MGQILESTTDIKYVLVRTIDEGTTYEWLWQGTPDRSFELMIRLLKETNEALFSNYGEDASPYRLAELITKTELEEINLVE